MKFIHLLNLTLRLNNHRKVVNRQNAPLVDQHFKLPGQNLNQHAQFILIEQLDNINIGKDSPTLKLKKEEDLWILWLKTLQPDGFNAELIIYKGYTYIALHV